jgi:hypothetical protein
VVDGAEVVEDWLMCGANPAKTSCKADHRISMLHDGAGLANSRTNQSLHIPM